MEQRDGRIGVAELDRIGMNWNELDRIGLETIEVF